MRYIRVFSSGKKVGPKISTPSDQSLELAIIKRFRQDVYLKQLSIDVSVYRGHAILCGTVAKRFQILNALKLAHEVNGIKEVTSRLQCVVHAPIEKEFAG